jgi:hypothetical protein
MFGVGRHAGARLIFFRATMLTCAALIALLATSAFADVYMVSISRFLARFCVRAGCGVLEKKKKKEKREKKNAKEFPILWRCAMMRRQIDDCE